MTNFMHKANGTCQSGAFWSFGLYSTGAISEAAAETAWGGAVTAFFAGAAVGALYRTDTVLTQTSTSTASPTWRQTTIHRTPHAQGGLATTQQLPDFCCPTVTLRTATANKSSHGRWFLPPPAAAALSMSTGPKISSASMATLSAGIATLFSTLATAGLSPVLLTRRPTIGGLPAFTTQAIISRDMSNLVAVQHRRGDKVPGGRVAA